MFTDSPSYNHSKLTSVKKPAVEQSYITLPKSGVGKRFVMLLKKYLMPKKKLINLI